MRNLKSSRRESESQPFPLIAICIQLLERAKGIPQITPSRSELLRHGTLYQGAIGAGDTGAEVAMGAGTGALSGSGKAGAAAVALTGIFNF